MAGRADTDREEEEKVCKYGRSSEDDQTGTSGGAIMIGVDDD